MPGETYIQLIINNLNKVHVCGEEDMRFMIGAIDMLKALKKDIITHKNPDKPAEGSPENV